MSVSDTAVARPLLANPMTGLEIGAGAFGVTASSISVGALLGELGGTIAGVAGVATIVLSVMTGNAKRRRQYEDDVRAAKEAGRQEVRDQLLDELTEARAERDDYRERYLNLLEQRRPR